MNSIKHLVLFLLHIFFCSTLNAGVISSESNSVESLINLNQQEKEWIDNNKSVNVAVKTGWMPIEFRLESEASRGIAIDYLNEISLLTGIRFNLVDYSESLDKSNVQLVSAISGNQTVDNFYKVEPNYLTLKYAAYINKNAKSNSNYTSFSELNKSRIAYFKSASLGQKLRETFPEAQLVQVDIADEAFQYLKQEQIDAYIGNEIVIDYHINFHRLSFAEKLSKTPFETKVYMAVHESHPILNSIIGKAIKQIGTNNQEILEYWNPSNLLTNYQIKFLAIAIILFLLFVLHWIYSNRKKIKTLKQNNMKEIWRQAHYDYQTSIPNRLYFEIKLNEIIIESSVTNTPFSLLYIDLDDFKDINDRYGHVTGDKILKEAAKRLSMQALENIFLARLGGDEFAIIVPEFDNENTVELLCEKILKSISSPFLIEENIFYISCSIGVAKYPHDTTSDIDLLSFADQAMYKAKEIGKNQCNYYHTDLTQKSLEKITIIQDLKEAIKTNQFNLVYQPIVDSLSLQVVKLKALIRWHHPVKGNIPPDKFIGIAEDSGLIHELGKWIFNQVISDIEYLKNSYSENISISINVSPVQFKKNESFEEFVNKLYFQNINIANICFEMTERMLLDPSLNVVQTISKLRKQGIKFSIDDFGTGHSALGYLNKYDIDFVKIDKSFVSDIETNNYNRIMCESIISMSHKLGIKLIAEGVENVEQQKILNSLGCDYFQGYLFERPIPIASLINKYSKKDIN